MARILTAPFSGSNGAGVVSVPEIKAGDVMVGMVRISDHTARDGNFSTFATADGEIYQTATSNLSGESIVALLSREAML